VREGEGTHTRTRTPYTSKMPPSRQARTDEADTCGGDDKAR